MTPRHGQEGKEKISPPHDGSLISQDKKRNVDEKQHHPETNLQPHPQHHPQKQPTDAPLHHPHTQPDTQALDIDHGTHEDRPKPGKIAKKSKRPVV